MLPKEQKLDLRVRRTRKLLKDALQALLEAKDYKHITVSNIAEQAMVNRATFYAHFDGKDTLLNYVLQEDFRELLEKRLENPCSFSMENVRVLMDVLCEYMVSFVKQCLPTACFTDYPPIERYLHQLTYDVMHGWLADNQGGGDASPHVVAMTTSWAIFGPAIQWARGGQKQIKKDKLINEVMAMLEPGLMPVLKVHVA